MDPRLIRLSEVKQEETGWLWPGRIPLGSITILDGDPGENKNTIINDIAARLTTGKPMYGCNGLRRPGGVILLDSEEPPSKVRDDLKAAGADLTRIVTLDQSSPSGKPLTIPDNCPLLERTATEIEADLIVLSPLTHFLGANINSDQAVRRAIEPLRSLAHHQKLAVIVVRHLTKTGRGHPLYRGAGSMGLIAVARSGLLVATDPGNAEHRVLAQTKSSLSKLSPSLLFRPLSKGTGLVLEWIGTSRFSAGELLESSRQGTHRALEEAMSVVYSALWYGPLPAKVVQKIAVDTGVAARTLRRAREILTTWKRVGFGPGATIYWSLRKEDEIVRRLRDKDLGDLIDDLIHGSEEGNASRPPREASFGEPDDENDPDPADWWKDGDDDDEHNDGDETAPICGTENEWPLQFFARGDGVISVALELMRFQFHEHSNCLISSVRIKPRRSESCRKRNASRIVVGTATN